MLSEQDLYKIKEIIGNSQEIDVESKNELLDKFNKSNLNGYGLNFIRSIEDVEKETYPYNKDKFIFLNEDTEKEIFKGEDLTNNILFEGDNLESLKVLNSTHKGKIDIIYIDPPYNTGNKDFIYNDSFVSNDDGFKHSKWLSFMEKRLKLAYNLLSKDGVIFISIDDNEQANLKLLCDKIFGEHNFIENFMWLHGKGKKTKQSRTLQQYTLCYTKSKQKLGDWKESQHLNYEFTNPDNDPKGSWFSGSISFNENRSNKNHKNFYTVVSPSGVVWERQWMVSESEMNNLIENSDIYFGESPKYNKVPRRKIRQGATSEIIPKNIFEDVGTTSSAEKEVFSMFGEKVFDYPKPVDLIKKIIKITNKSKDITVLDFFAGSGTTGHAVLELNKEDGGNRKFILCTNNENNICEEVTYQRLSKVINGYKTQKGIDIEGIFANLNYFKVDYIDTNEIYDFSDIDVIPYIELKEGVRYNFINNFEYCSSKEKYVFLVGIENDMLKVQEFLKNNDEKEVVIYCNSQSIKNKYFNTEFYPLFKSIDKDTILNISKDN